MQQDNAQNQHADDTAPPAGQGETASPVATQPKSKHFKTEGEKKFDFLTYNAIGYMANVLLSVGAVYWVERTHSGQKFMDSLVNLAKKIPGVDEGWAKLIATKSFFLTGGFAVIPPMKMLEDKKAEWVKKENHKIYGDKADTDPTLLQSQKELEAAPKQTWASLASSRLLSLIPFYITTGILWDRMSPLSKLTNPKLGALSKDAIKAMDPSELSHIASKGAYFDNPIAWASRHLGKFGAWAMGDSKALTQLETMQQRHPGIIKAPDLLEKGKVKGEHDPIHSALPYYFISEAITSAMVAWGIFVISRITAPFFDKGKNIEHAPAAPDAKINAAAETVNAAPTARTAAAAQPTTRIDKQGIEYQAPTADLAIARV
jgi:hypothetical protein